MVRRTHRCMGTVASIHVHDHAPVEAVEAAVTATFAELDRLEALFSTFRPTSEISRINRGELHLLDASAEVIEVVDACTWLEHETAGAFCAHPPDDPGRLDPAGFVKGWAAETASHRLADAGLGDWYLSVGGDVQVAGSPAPGEPWRFGIADPLRAGEVLAAVDLGDGAVATSGTAERGAHLWDGRTGNRLGAGDGARRPELASVTVVGPHLTWADAFATATFAMGVEGLDWVARFPDHHAIAVTRTGELLTTPALRTI